MRKRVKNITHATIKTGKEGEKIAREYLEKSGYKILGTNVRYSKVCETDIIAQDGDTVVFVEVKTRMSESYGHPFEAIDKRKIQKIYTGALTYLAERNSEKKKFRIDAVAVIGIKNPKIEHIKNIGFD